MMTKNRAGRLWIAGLLAVSMVAASFAYTGTMGLSDANASSKISWSQAKRIFKEELPKGATIKYVHLTRDDGRRIYKGKAVKGNYVYSIEMTAASGRILEKDKDYEGSRYAASKAGAVSKSTIRSKIRAEVPGAIIIYVKLDRDDGRYVYEAEAYKDGYEYEFEFTKRGSILEYERDKV